MLCYVDTSSAIPRNFLDQTFNSRGQKGASPSQCGCRAYLRETVRPPWGMKYHMQEIVLLMNSLA